MRPSFAPTNTVSKMFRRSEHCGFKSLVPCFCLTGRAKRGNFNRGGGAKRARFAPPPRLKLPRFARPVKQKQGTNDLKPQCSDLRNILLTVFVGAKLGRTFFPVFQ